MPASKDQSMLLVSPESASMFPVVTVNMEASCASVNSMPVVVPDLATDVLSETVSVRSRSVTVRVPVVERALSVSSRVAESASAGVLMTREEMSS